MSHHYYFWLRFNYCQQLYSPAWLKQEWQRLEADYGAKRLKQAQRYGRIVFKQNDPQVVEDIILSMSVFGEDKVKRAFDIVAQKSVDNSKRCYEYVKGTLARMKEQEEAD